MHVTARYLTLSNLIPVLHQLGIFILLLMLFLKSTHSSVCHVTYKQLSYWLKIYPDFSLLTYPRLVKFTDLSTVEATYKVRLYKGTAAYKGTL